MKKQELSDLLHSLQIPVNEGIASQENTNKYPRVLRRQYGLLLESRQKN